MKLFLYCVAPLLLLSLISSAQTVSDLSVSIPVITINAKIIGKDSVIIPFNEKYIVVQDSCTQIIRYGHYDFKNRCFYGKFTDIKKGDSTKIIAQGNFSAKGLKNGMFVINNLDGTLQARGNFVEDKYDGDWVFYYPNGKLKAKGSFRKNKYIGKWEMYYENGQPNLFFYDENGICRLMNYWNAESVKIVNKGNGYYQSNMSGAHWIGKLTNGLPDSIWTFHMGRDNDDNATVTEYFEKSIFQQGNAGFGGYSRNYTDVSSISLFPQLPVLLISHSQYLDVSTSCNGRDLKEAYVKMFNKTYHNISMPLDSSKGN